MNQLQADLCAPRRSMGYLSGPVSGATAAVRNRHYFQALDISHQLWELEILHYCPHANSPRIGATDVEYTEWMRMDLEVLRRCDWVLMVGDWAASDGCKREFNLAQALQIPIAYTTQEAARLSILLDRQIAGTCTEELV